MIYRLEIGQTPRCGRDTEGTSTDVAFDLSPGVEVNSTAEGSPLRWGARPVTLRRIPSLPAHQTSHQERRIRDECSRDDSASLELLCNARPEGRRLSNIRISS
jgi:hypothetical protein